MKYEIVWTLGKVAGLLKVKNKNTPPSKKQKNETVQVLNCHNLICWRGRRMIIGVINRRNKFPSFVLKITETQFEQKIKNLYLWLITEIFMKMKYNLKTANPLKYRYITETFSVFSGDHPCQYDNARFPTVSLTPLSDL